MPCSDCGGYMKKVPKINKNKKMKEDRDYYRCKDCGKTVDDIEYFDKDKESKWRKNR